MPRCYRPNELTIDFSSFGLNMFKFALRNTCQVRSWERRGDVGTLYLWIQCGLHAWSEASCRMGFVLKKPPELSLPECFMFLCSRQLHTEVWKPDWKVTRVKPYWSVWPHDLWGHQANISQFSPKSSSFHHHSPRGAHRSFHLPLREEHTALSTPRPTEDQQAYLLQCQREGLAPAHLLFQSSRGAQRSSFQLTFSRKPPRNPSFSKLLAATQCPAGKNSTSN